MFQIIFRFSLSIIVMGLIFTGLPTPRVYAQSTPPICNVQGNIQENTTWTSGCLYVVTGHVTVLEGVTLVVEAGTIIKFNANKLMGVRGVLKVEGTKNNPVYITSIKDDGNEVGGDTNGDGGGSSPAMGDWGHISFMDVSNDAENLIKHAIFRYGGKFFNNNDEYYGSCWDCTYGATIRIFDASPTIQNNTIEHGFSYALFANINSFPTVSGNTLIDNQTNGLGIDGGTMSDTSEAQHWHNTDVVYVVYEHITIGNGVTFVIDPGVTVKFRNNKLIGVKGTLKVEGTAENPVRFTSLKDDTIGGDTNGDGGGSSPAMGDWGHISFMDESNDAKNLIKHAIFRYGGKFFNDNDEYYGSCWDCTYGATIRIFDASPTIQNNTVEHGFSYALFANTNSFPTVSGNTLIDNQTNGLGIDGGTMSDTSEAQHWHNADVVYVVHGHITIGSGVTFVIDPGVTVKFGGNRVMGVKGTLKVEGTAENPVRFTSLKDDTIGGDTNGDGGGSSPAMGDWGHISFMDESNDAENLIKHAIFRYGGKFFNDNDEYYGSCWDCTYGATIRIFDASPTIQNNTIEHGFSYALFANTNSFPTVSGNTLIENQTNGLGIDGGTMSDTSEAQHWHNTDVVYVVHGHITIGSGVTFVIDPGVTIKFFANKVMGVKGTLKVEGTAENPVYITSHADDSVGGDTNGDGGGSSPAPGNWGHIALLKESAGNDHRIEYAAIRYGGHFFNNNDEYHSNCWDCTYKIMLGVWETGLTMHNTLVEHSVDGLYIYRQNDDPGLDIQYNTFRFNQGAGIRIDQ